MRKSQNIVVLKVSNQQTPARPLLNIQKITKVPERTATTAEACLWDALVGRKIGHHFRRKVVIDNWVADFWCRTAKLVVGLVKSQKGIDTKQKQDEALAQLGIKSIWFTNNEVLKNRNQVVMKIRFAAECSALPSSIRSEAPPRTVPPRTVWSSPPKLFRRLAQAQKKLVRNKAKVLRLFTGWERSFLSNVFAAKRASPRQLIVAEKLLRVLGL